MQRKKNGVKARTTLLLSLPDEHQLRFSMYKTAQELWAAILKTFGGNEATKKTKKNVLKQQCGNFKAKGSKTLEQTFNRLQIIIDEDDMEEIDIKWNMALLSMRVAKFWKKTGKKISIQGSDVAGFDKSKIECFNCHKMGYFARECRAPRSQDRGRRDNLRQRSKAEEQAPKALMAIDKIKTLEYYNESYKECNDSLKKKLETLQQEKKGVDGNLASLLTASKDLDNLIESQRSEKNKEGLRYTAIPPPTTQLYLSPKKDLSWTSLPECADDTVTDYSWPSPSAESISEDDQNKNTSVSKTVASPITCKPFIKFVRPKDSQSDSKTGKNKTPNKPPVKKRVKQNFAPRPFAHKPYRLSQRPVKTHMNDAWPNRTFFNKQAHSYTNTPVHRTLAVRSPSRAPWVPTVNRNYSPVNRKFSTDSRNFPTTNRKFPTASRKSPTGGTKGITADMGLKGKAVI
nr:hypothetical protein [Tanacetum cinerariifolium]